MIQITDKLDDIHDVLCREVGIQLTVHSDGKSFPPGYRSLWFVGSDGKLTVCFDSIGTPYKIDNNQIVIRSLLRYNAESGRMDKLNFRVDGKSGHLIGLTREGKIDLGPFNKVDGTVGISELTRESTRIQELWSDRPSSGGRNKYENGGDSDKEADGLELDLGAGDFGGDF